MRARLVDERHYKADCTGARQRGTDCLLFGQTGYRLTVMMKIKAATPRQRHRMDNLPGSDTAACQAAFRLKPVTVDQPLVSPASTGV